MGKIRVVNNRIPTHPVDLPPEWREQWEEGVAIATRDGGVTEEQAGRERFAAVVATMRLAGCFGGTANGGGS
jgi:hypothetical protein